MYEIGSGVNQTHLTWALCGVYGYVLNAYGNEVAVSIYTLLSI